MTDDLDADAISSELAALHDGEPLPPLEPLLPLSRERIRDALEARRTPYRVDSDLDIGVKGDHGFVWVLAEGQSHEILVLRGFWSRRLPLAERDRLLEAANDDNGAYRWPRSCVFVDDEGTVGIRAEHVVDFELGVTDAQLDYAVHGGLSAVFGAFARYAERFPEPGPEPEW